MATSHLGSRHVHATIVRGETAETRWDAVAGEEPLQIRACGPEQSPIEVAVTMRTPGFEEELAVGFLIAEGLLDAADAPAAEFQFGDPALASQPHNEILVRLPRSLDLDAVAERHFVATASCGICGRASMDELIARVSPLPAGPVVARSTVLAMPARMREAQAVFESTGGLHAAALFTPSGELVALREDIGRHNAVDKLIGARALGGAVSAADAAAVSAAHSAPDPVMARAADPVMAPADSVLVVSGRVSFEIVQKAAVARFPVLCAVSAPSDLAVSTAERLEMTLVGFLRGDGFNLYAGAGRIDLAA